MRASRLIAQVIPVSLGDNYRGFRIVGTEPALIEHYRGRLAAGAIWTAPMQAVLGADVAHTAGLAVASTFAGTHGLTEGGAVHEDSIYRVDGVLAPTGTVLDRLIISDKESVWRVHEGEPTDASELARLFALVGVGIDTMRVFAAVLIASSLLALFTTLYNALEERRYDIAIMRLLAASRGRIAGLLLLEAWLLAFAALIAGVLIGLVAVAVVGHWLAQARAFSVAALVTPELLWIGIVAFLTATLAALLPAWRAGRMDVAQTLAKG